MSFFDKNAVGRLVTRTVNDIETIASIFSQGLFTIIADILKMITVLTVMTVFFHDTHAEYTQLKTYSRVSNVIVDEHLFADDTICFLRIRTH